jgi:hypothetical protein
MAADLVSVQNWGGAGLLQEIHALLAGNCHRWTWVFAIFGMKLLSPRSLANATRRLTSSTPALCLNVISNATSVPSPNLILQKLNSSTFLNIIVL